MIFLWERGLEERNRGVSVCDDYVDIKVCEMIDMNWNWINWKIIFDEKNIMLMEVENF